MLARPVAGAHREVRVDEQRVGLLVELVERDELRRELDRLLAGAHGEPRGRRLPQHGSGQAGDVAALGEQPRIERGPGLDVDPLQQLPPETGDHDGLDPGRRPECQDVDEGVGRHLEDDRVAGERDARSHRAPQLGEVPAQGAERVVGVGEQQAGEPLARRRRPAEDEVREERPGLRAARSGDGSTVDLDPWRADEVDPERQRRAPVDVRGARLGRRGSRPHIVVGRGGRRQACVPRRRNQMRAPLHRLTSVSASGPSWLASTATARRSASRVTARASEAATRVGSRRRRVAATAGGHSAGRVVLIVVIEGSCDRPGRCAEPRRVPCDAAGDGAASGRVPGHPPDHTGLGHGCAAVTHRPEESQVMPIVNDHLLAGRPAGDRGLPGRVEQLLAREHVEELLAEAQAERLVRGSRRADPGRLGRFRSAIAAAARSAATAATAVASRSSTP